jgi:hypothetical protein
MFLEKGHKNIGYVNPYRSNQTHESIIDSAVKEKMKESKININFLDIPMMAIHTNNEYEGQLKRFIAKHKITGFLCFDTFIQELLVFHLKKTKYRIPEDISLIGFGNANIWPEMQRVHAKYRLKYKTDNPIPLTCFSIDYDNIADYLFTSIVSMRKGDSYKTNITPFKMPFIQGKTLI